MLQSMTGYGEAVEQDGELYYSAQIKTVNNKSLKTTLKMPESVGFVEDKIEKLIRSNLSRGTVYFALQLKDIAEKPLVKINRKAASYYVDSLASVIGDKAHCRIDAATLLSCPGVVEPYVPDEIMRGKIEAAVCKVAEAAIENLKNSRQREGKLLCDDLLMHCRNIEKLLEKVAVRAPVVVDEYKTKLEKRINELLKAAKLAVDEQQLIREVAIFADRSDISEEIARLHSHLKFFTDETNSSVSIGRRLDFLCQEMFREVNTLGSKSSDVQICKCVVDMKCSVDRIKEQVQNVE
jgi:uncharacterized protein (TIGR00255 family)